MKIARRTVNIYPEWMDNIKSLHMPPSEEARVWRELFGWLCGKEKTESVENVAPYRKRGNPNFAKGKGNCYLDVRKKTKVGKSVGIKVRVDTPKPTAGSCVDSDAERTSMAVESITCYKSEDPFVGFGGERPTWDTIRKHLIGRSIPYTHFDPEKFFRHCEETGWRYRDGRPLDWTAAEEWSLYQENKGRYRHNSVTA